MVAIMILGVGVVMVATVFPVGIEMSRQPIQTYINLAIADTAAATLKAKVPGYRNLDGATFGTNFTQILLNSTHRVLVPDVQDIEITSPGEDPGIINQQEIELFANLGAPPTMLFAVGSWPLSPVPPISHLQWWSAPAWFTYVSPGPPVPLAPTNQTVPEFISRARLFTERTGWSGEVDVAGMSGFATAAVVPSHNLPAIRDLRDPSKNPNLTLNSIPVMVHPSLFGTYTSDLPRVNLVDQVYPPINLNLPNGLVRDYGDRDVVWGGSTVRVPGVFPELEASRYCWTAFHHRLSSEAPQAGKTRTNRDILATIVTLHRADLGARFARQQTLDSNKTSGRYVVTFNLNDPDHREAMFQPQADVNIATDALFPRPWLAAIYKLDLQNGQAVVTPELARMLPTGSYFIIATKIGPLFPGVAIQVTRSEWDARLLGTSLDTSTDASLASFPAWTTIEVTRSNLGPVAKVPVWVFPPAVTNLAGVRDTVAAYDFQSRSPAVGVELRRIAVR